jgi:hypothetical protein
MQRRLVILAVVTFAIVAMSAQDQVSSNHATGQGQQNTKHSSAPTIVPVANNQAASYYEQDSTPKPKGWHKLVAWPEGITAWLIMLTLGAIIWQAWETRNAAEASREAIILQFGPKVQVKTLRLPQGGVQELEVRLTLRNIGAKSARIQSSLIEFLWTRTLHPNEVCERTIAPFTLEAGHSRTFFFKLPELHARFTAYRLMLEQSPDTQQAQFLGCVGLIPYTDEIGIRKEDVEISSLYSFSKKAFLRGNRAKHESSQSENPN